MFFTVFTLSDSDFPIQNTDECVIDFFTDGVLDNIKETNETMCVFIMLHNVFGDLNNVNIKERIPFCVFLEIVLFYI